MLIDFMVMEVVEDRSVRGWGPTRFAVVPRIGEVVVRDVEGIAHVYEVLMVMHPPKPVSVGRDRVEYSGGALWVTDRGPQQEWIKANIKSKR